MNVAIEGFRGSQNKTKEQAIKAHSKKCRTNSRVTKGGKGQVSSALVENQSIVACL